VIRAQHRVADRRSRFFDQQCGDVTIVQLARLYVDAERAGEVERHVGRVVGRGKGVVEGATRQLRYDGGIGGRGDPNIHRTIVTLRLRSGQVEHRELSLRKGF
jgi:hypothetical protein